MSFLNTFVFFKAVLALFTGHSIAYDFVSYSRGEMSLVFSALASRLDQLLPSVKRARNCRFASSVQISRCPLSVSRGSIRHGGRVFVSRISSADRSTHRNRDVIIYIADIVKQLFVHHNRILEAKIHSSVYRAYCITACVHSNHDSEVYGDMEVAYISTKS
jgi:hypothetical protein